MLAFEPINRFSEGSRSPLWVRSGHCKLLHPHSGTGSECNDGDECNQNEDHQYHGLRDRERWFRLRRSQRIESRNFHEALHDKNKDV